MHKQRRLKNYLIFPKFQLTLIFLTLFIISMNFVFIFTQISDSFSDLFLSANALNISHTSPFYKVLEFHEKAIWSKVFIAASIIYVLSIILTIFITHRVLGPIQNVKNYFLKMNETGEIAPLKFRKGDYYDDLPEIINKGIDKALDKNKN